MRQPRLPVLPAVRHLAGAVACVVACLTLGACASQLKKAESELVELSDLLPGRYNNVAQAQQDLQAGRAQHAPLILDIVRVDMPLLSDYVFYTQETAADDPLRITSQRILTFEAIKDGRIVQRIHTFKQPARWRDGQLNPGLFKGLMATDTTQMAGCDLDWKKDGEKFVGQNVRDVCRVNGGSLGSVKVDMRAELSGDEFAIAELSYTAGGKLVKGDAAEPFYRFQRGDAP
jgi:hypothetical protein